MVRVRDEAPVNSPVAQRQSTRPITGRPRIVTVRENQQQQETNMTMMIKNRGGWPPYLHHRWTRSVQA